MLRALYIIIPLIIIIVLAIILISYKGANGSMVNPIALESASPGTVETYNPETGEDDREVDSWRRADSFSYF